ncbi:MAG: phosphoenolpyruvate--protein phosphotransferase [Treponema sp.]|nr:phosphoenolpyruvate--protein phosphotransferase [Treponema sp.]MEE3433993.1 phosphoenolpyruvate--protein phosphotransferase [Treponema sp.]
MDLFFGASVSPGIGRGNAFVIPDQAQRVIPQTPITAEQVDSEWLRYVYARDSVAEQIKIQLEQIQGNKEIFETYSLMLADPVFNKEVGDCIAERLFNVEFILDFKMEEYAQRLRDSGNDYLAERAQDIIDIFGRVLNELLNIHPFDMEQVPEGVVLIAQSLNASDAMVISKKRLSGLALVEGGLSSHVAILARSYGVPAVFALPKEIKQIQNSERIILDADSAELIVDPDAGTVLDYQKKVEQIAERKKALLLFRSKPAQTKDGERFHLYANIGTVEEAKIALEEGAEGIGLFRTEFLFMNELNSGEGGIRSVSEQTQFEAYKEVLQIMGDRPVTIRTLDAGGDKLLKMVDAPADTEKNPLMGLRAIRMSLKTPQLFKTQLRALYRASVYGNLKIMFPLITSQEQVEQARNIASQVRDELLDEGIKVKDVPIGIMVETAAAGIIADCLATVSDFFSIGTNDLTQYTLGVDRENINVADCYDESHLAVMRLIQNTIKAADGAGIPVSVCGEMASRIDSAMMLAGMGIRNLSMGPSQISLVKEKLSTITVKELEAILDGKRR